jgi:hypothetical protein
MSRRRLARVVNPKPETRLARVVNPLPTSFDFVRTVSNPESERADVDSLFEEFRGKPSEFVTELEVAPDVPLNLAELGGLIELELDSGEVQEFDPEETKLCADADGNLHIAGYRLIDDEVPSDEKVFLGEIARVVYEADKPHLYPNDGEAEFEHVFGEDVPGAALPDLYYQDGFLLIEGGDYVCAPEGIKDVAPRRPNGIFTDGLRYTAGRLDERKARKKREKREAAIARAKAS